MIGVWLSRYYETLLFYLTTNQHTLERYYIANFTVKNLFVSHHVDYKIMSPVPPD